jgi:hypothetical protein
MTVQEARAIRIHDIKKNTELYIEMGYNYDGNSFDTKAHDQVNRTGATAGLALGYISENGNYLFPLVRQASLAMFPIPITTKTGSIYMLTFEKYDGFIAAQIDDINIKRLQALQLIGEIMQMNNVQEILDWVDPRFPV